MRTHSPKPGWKEVFLEELGKWGVVAQAARVAGITKQAAYASRERDAKFARAWEEAEERPVALMESLAIQRATVGQRTPVFFQGKIVEHIHEIDNGLLKWLLAKKKPQVYGDHTEKPKPLDVNLNISGRLNLDRLNDDQLETLRDILTAAVVPGDGEPGDPRPTEPDPGRTEAL